MGDSGEGRDRRSAVCAGTHLADACGGASCCGGVKFRYQSREADRRGGQCQIRRAGRNHVAGKIGAGYGSLDAGCAGLWLAHHGGHLLGHGAMMCAVTSAAGGQARIITGGKCHRQRPRAKEQNQENGKRAPHLRLIVHENRIGAIRAESGRPSVGYHRGIQFSME